MSIASVLGQIAAPFRAIRTPVAREPWHLAALEAHVIDQRVEAAIAMAACPTHVRLGTLRNGVSGQSGLERRKLIF